MRRRALAWERYRNVRACRHTAVGRATRGVAAPPTRLHGVDGVVAPTSLDELTEHSADPGAVRNALDRLGGEACDRIAADAALAAAVVTLMAASRSGTRPLSTAQRASAMVAWPHIVL